MPAKKTQTHNTPTQHGGRFYWVKGQRLTPNEYAELMQKQAPESDKKSTQSAKTTKSTKTQTQKASVEVVNEQ